MHPAFSVIMFTTLSGAGYGSLALLGVFGLFNWLPADPSFGLCATTVSLVMISAGLVSSTSHLGQPRRAWRALSQWRSSWLSREGVFAVLTYLPTSIFWITFLMPEQLHQTKPIINILTVLFPIITIYCTAKIYSSLKTIRQWNHQLVVPAYLLIGLFGGAIILIFLLSIFGIFFPILGYFVILSGFITGILKITYWKSIDNANEGSTPESAIGLGGAGKKVSLLDAPTTSENFVMREMGFKIARKHSTRLRLTAMFTLFIAPSVITLITTLNENSTSIVVLSLVAVIFMCLGSVIERWLFFAEAKHVVTLYYGATRA